MKSLVVSTTFCLLLAVGGRETLAQGAPTRFGVEATDSKLIIRYGEREVTQYVFLDANIPRPYFSQLRTPKGVLVTRNHPPIDGVDSTDHATMHPGVWLAFGDLDGEDFWRNKATVKHVRFVEPPRVEGNYVTFLEEKRYIAADGREVCREHFRWRLGLRAGGFLMEWTSRFTSERGFYFGDQEEMGLGVRVASPIAEKKGGHLRDSEGRKGAKQIWSHSARWCDYYGKVAGDTVGVTVFCHPENFRPSWFHARNYGFMAANPFGRKAMNKGEVSKVHGDSGKSLELKYGVWFRGPEGDSDIDAVYRAYVTSMD